MADVALSKAKESLQVQKGVFVLSLLLFLLKVYSWKLTGSLAILSDALESTVNVLAGFIGLASLYIAAKPKDSNHPFGHGKVEFLSAAAEGTMIIIAGLVILYGAVTTFFEKKTIERLDAGLVLIVITAIINYIAGTYCVKKGIRNNSLALQASGKHLQTDTYSTIGIIVGLIVILFTKMYILDKIIAMGMGLLIIYNGYKIMQQAFSGIMDEADKHILEKMAKVLNQHRRNNWVDIHNLRVVKYGSLLNVDCHFTLPWYMNLQEAHKELNILITLVEQAFGDRIEFFVHTDDCREKSCAICLMTDCTMRMHDFEQKIEWTFNNISNNERHSILTCNSNHLEKNTYDGK